MRHLREKDFQDLLRYVQEAKEHAKMETANFDSIGPHDGPDDAPQQPLEGITSFIRRRTRIWRGSWLVEPLEEAERILKEEARRD